MGWRTEAQTVKFEAQDRLKNAKDDISQFFKSKVGTARANFQSLVTGSSYVGINGNRIRFMRDAIRGYVKAIQDNLDKVVADASTTKAFKGEFAGAVTAYVKAVEETCKAFTTPLLEFSDNLDLIAEVYHRKDEELASSIRSSAAEAESTAKANVYTEQRSDTSYGNTKPSPFFSSVGSKISEMSSKVTSTVAEAVSGQGLNTVEGAGVISKNDYNVSPPVNNSRMTPEYIEAIQNMVNSKK